MARLVVVSFRLGARDGVSIEAQKWIDALSQLGHRVTTVAGSGVADVLIPGLGIRDERELDDLALASVLENADLVVVENMASLPLNPAARDALYRVLDQRPALFHHHDLAWQRPEGANDPPPLDRPWWRHVTINDVSRRELARRGVDSLTLYNSFDVDPPPGDRHVARDALGVDSERVVLFPMRALRRKNVGGAVRLAEELDGVLWLLGPAEDGFDDELSEILSRTRHPIRQGVLEGHDIHDAYAASDLVVVPSTWEGFGNPVLESVTHRRLLAVHPYPVLEEIRAFGFHFFGLDDVREIADSLTSPSAERFDSNLAIARAHFNLAHLPSRLASLLAAWGLE